VSEKPTPAHGSSPRRSAPINRGGELKRTTPLERHTSLERTSGPTRTAPLARKTTPKRQAISPASPGQRAKTHGKPCVVCGAPATTPMHLWPRGQGGCDDPLCVLPACWRCHRNYDTGELELLPHIVKQFRAEIAHAQLHTDPVSLLARLAASEVVLRSLIRPRIAAGTAPSDSQPTIQEEPTGPATDCVRDGEVCTP
jgi:hypothetical protein